MMKYWNDISFQLTPTEVKSFDQASPAGKRRILEAVESWVASRGAGQPEMAAEWVEFSMLSLSGLDEALDERQMTREFRLPREDAPDLAFRGVLLAESSDTKWSSIVGRELKHCRVRLFRSDSAMYVLTIHLAPGADAGFLGLIPLWSATTRLSTHASPAELFDAVNKLSDFERLVATRAVNKARMLEPAFSSFGVNRI